MFFGFILGFGCVSGTFQCFLGNFGVWVVFGCSSGTAGGTGILCGLCIWVVAVGLRCLLSFLNSGFWFR